MLSEQSTLAPSCSGSFVSSLLTAVTQQDCPGLLICGFRGGLGASQACCIWTPGQGLTPWKQRHLPWLFCCLPQMMAYSAGVQWFCFSGTKRCRNHVPEMGCSWEWCPWQYSESSYTSVCQDECVEHVFDRAEEKNLSVNLTMRGEHGMDEEIILLWEISQELKRPCSVAACLAPWGYSWNRTFWELPAQLPS